MKLCPGVSVSGKLNPVVLKLLPVTLACPMLRVVPPALVTVCDFFEFVPTATLPKLRLVGLAVSAVGLAPVPERFTKRALSVELELNNTILPLAVEAADGENVTLNWIVLPGAIVSGRLTFDMRNEVASTRILVIVRLIPPVFES